MALAVSFVSTGVYYASLEESKEEVIDQSIAWMVVGGLSLGWICTFIAIMLLMNSRYRTTFIATQTGGEWARSLFIEGERDMTKMIMVTFNKKLWLSIRDDVKAWTLENWERWEEEKPEWRTQAWMERVDDDMIPPDNLRKMNGGGSARRRSSLGDLRGGGPKVAPVSGKIQAQ